MSMPDRKYLVHKPQELRNLSAKLQGEIDLSDPKWVFQTKHDGCHCIVMVGINVVRIFSREGKECFSMPHIAEHFRVNSLPNMVYFGEAWHADKDFPEISGLFRRGASKPSYELSVWLFDAVTLQEFRAGSSERPYAQRIKALTHVLDQSGAGMVYPVITKASVELCKQWAEEYRDKLGIKFALDGYMAKDSNGLWKAGVDRDGVQLKLKDVLSVDLRCTGVFEGEGKFAGMVGGLLVEYKGVEQKCGGGKLTDTERKTYWVAMAEPIEVAPMMLPESIVGKIVEVHALGETPDGRLREPRFQRVRDDKTEPSE